jgi:O-glycosyl hydrolase
MNKLFFCLLISVSMQLSAQTFQIDPTQKHQEMIGFGGALSWYSNRVISSQYKNDIMDLMFTDLGLDILRLKNWYYPANYPTYKGVTNMETSWFRSNFEANQEFFTKAKASYPQTQVLLSSWGPPSGLKSNGNLSGGTLKKVNNQFAYSEFAQYFEDVLDNLGFHPDWLSIQNEPGYIDTWTTCEWRPTPTSTFPGYNIAFDSVYHRIKNRPQAPQMIGAEAANLGNARWNSSLNTFRAFTNPIKNHPGLFAYAYHPYNFTNSSSIEGKKGLLNIIRDEFGDKSNIMTEFSKENFSWHEMASMIQNTLIEANTSGYIYWKLIWDDQSSDAMIGIDNAGNYTVTEYYYLIKHFAKYIDEGDHRIDLAGSGTNLKATAFLSGAEDSITVVITNRSLSAFTVSLDLVDGNLDNAFGFQSKINHYFQPISIPRLDSISIPGHSVTTIVAGYMGNTNPIDEMVAPSWDIYPNPATNRLWLQHDQPKLTWTIYSIDGKMLKKGDTDSISLTGFANGLYFIKSGNSYKRFIVNK